jgi:hypothetical protein
MPAGRADPSPVMPILLLCIVGFILMASTYFRLATSYTYPMMPTRVVQPVLPAPRTPNIGAFLIPAVLVVIFLQAIGLHELGNPLGPQTLLAVLVSMIERMSFPMFITFFLMILLIMMNLGTQRPHSQVRPYVGSRYYY